jgi:hypothetical protein
MVIWVVGASSLSWENKKLTWLVLTLTAASGAVQARPRRRTSGPEETGREEGVELMPELELVPEVDPA